MPYDGAHGTLGRILDLWVLVNLALMMFQPRVGDRADIGTRAGRWVVGWQDGGDWAHDGTNAFVHSLVLGRVYCFFERRTGFSTEIGVSGDAGVLVQDVVVVGGGFGNGADQAWCVHIEVWVRGRKDRVGGANDWADLLCGSRHDAVVLVDRYPVGGLAVAAQRLWKDQIPRTFFDDEKRMKMKRLEF